MRSGSGKSYAWLLIPVAIAAGLWFGWPWVAHQLALRILEAKAPDVGRAAPEFGLENSAGKRVRLSDFHGKVVLLNFWAIHPALRPPLSVMLRCAFASVPAAR